MVAAVAAAVAAAATVAVIGVDADMGVAGLTCIGMALVEVTRGTTEIVRV